MLRLPRLDGPAPAWPRGVDAVLEGWAGLPGRARAALRGGLVVLVVLSATGGLVRGPWGAPVTVVVAARTVPAGALLEPGDLTSTRWPADLVPADALTDVAHVGPGAVASGRLVAGQVVTAAHVDAAGPAGTATDGTAVVPLPVELVPALPVGTRLDLAASTFDGGASLAARDAVLVADDGAWRWVRVDRDDVAAVVSGLAAGTLSVAVLPPAPRGAAP